MASNKIVLMDKNKVDHILKGLESIKKVDAPPFLLTKIYQKIENQKNQELSPTLSLAIKIVWIFFITLNVSVLIYSSKPYKTNQDVSNLGQRMHLISNNTLYK